MEHTLGALFAWFCNDQLCCMQQMRASAVQMRTLISAFYTEDLKLFSYLRIGGSNVQLQIKIYLHSYKLHTYTTFFATCHNIISDFSKHLGWQITQL